MSTNTLRASENNQNTQAPGPKQGLNFMSVSIFSNAMPCKKFIGKDPTYLKNCRALNTKKEKTRYQLKT